MSDKCAPETVCFFCAECYLELHYDTQGKLQEGADHVQFPYFHD